MPRFNAPLAAGLGLLVGSLAGLLGAGGIPIVPLLIGIMRLPTRLAIGTSPVVILISGSFGLVGKFLSLQVQPDLAGRPGGGAPPCAYLGRARPAPPPPGPASPPGRHALPDRRPQRGDPGFVD